MKYGLAIRPYIAAMLAAVALSACVVAPPMPYYASGTYVNTPPPAPQYEAVGVPPVQGYIWIGGYWGWHEGRHSWVGGHWEAPRPGYRWVPHAWIHEGNG